MSDRRMRSSPVGLVEAHPDFAWEVRNFVRLRWAPVHHHRTVGLCAKSLSGSRPHQGAGRKMGDWRLSIELPKTLILSARTQSTRPVPPPNPDPAWATAWRTD